jgi:hypothetical protein
MCVCMWKNVRAPWVVTQALFWRPCAEVKHLLLLLLFWECVASVNGHLPPASIVGNRPTLKTIFFSCLLLRYAFVIVSFNSTLSARHSQRIPTRRAILFKFTCVKLQFCSMNNTDTSDVLIRQMQLQTKSNN